MQLISFLCAPKYTSPILLQVSDWYYPILIPQRQLQHIFPNRTEVRCADAFLGMSIISTQLASMILLLQLHSTVH